MQREMPGSFVVGLSYVGGKGTHLTLERNLNQLPALPPSENPFGPNEPLTLGDCTVPPGGLGHPGDFSATPFLLQNGTIVTSQNPAYIHLQAACASPNTPNVNSLPRPYPGLGQALSLENVANSSYQALQFSLRRTRGPLTTSVSYAYSHSLDNSSDRSDPVMVDSYDLRGNRASSNFDQRHLLNISYIYDFVDLPRWIQSVFTDSLGDSEKSPQGEQTPPSPSRAVRALFEGWQVSGVTTLQSGTPFTVINNAGDTGISLTDNAGVASGFGIAASYPDVAQRPFPHSFDNPKSVGPLLGNPMQFVAPRGLTFGNAGRNYLNNPGRMNFDIALLRVFKIAEFGQMEFRAEAFNIFNQTQYRVYDPDNVGGTGNNVISWYAGPIYSAGFRGSAGADCVSGASFLHPINAHRPRTIQFGLKWAF